MGSGTKALLGSIVIFGCSVVCCGPAAAQLVVDPGASVVFASGDGFTTHVTPCDGANLCTAKVDLAGNSMSLWVNIAGGLNMTRHAAATVYNRFLLSPPPAGSAGERRLSAFVSGKVTYEGELHLGGTLGEAYARATITVRLRDLTDNVIVAEDVLLDSACSGGSWINADFCWAHPSGSRDFNLSATLIRGHTYQFDIEGLCANKIQLAGGTTQCQFLDTVAYPGNGIGRGPVQLTVERDLEEEILELRKDLEALKREYASHSHVYRTGVGTGHNSVPAKTGGPR